MFSLRGKRSEIMFCTPFQQCHQTGNGYIVDKTPVHILLWDLLHKMFSNCTFEWEKTIEKVSMPWSDLGTWGKYFFSQHLVERGWWLAFKEAAEAIIAWVRTIKSFIYQRLLSCQFLYWMKTITIFNTQERIEYQMLFIVIF